MAAAADLLELREGTRLAPLFRAMMDAPRALIGGAFVTPPRCARMGEGAVDLCLPIEPERGASSLNVFLHR